MSCQLNPSAHRVLCVCILGMVYIFVDSCMASGQYGRRGVGAAFPCLGGLAQWCGLARRGWPAQVAQSRAALCRDKSGRLGRSGCRFWKSSCSHWLVILLALTRFTRQPHGHPAHRPGLLCHCRPTVPHQGSCVDPRFLTRAPVSTHGSSPGLLCRPTVPHQGSCVDPRFLTRAPVSTHGSSPGLLCQPTVPHEGSYVEGNHGPSRGLLCRGQPHGPSRGLLCRWHGLYPQLCLPPLSKFPYHRLHDVA